MSTGRRSALARVVPVLLAVALAGTGCTGGRAGRDHSDDRPTGGQAVRKMTFELAAGSSSVTVAVPAKPVATVGTKTGGVAMEVYALDRTESVVDVVIAVHNTTDEQIKAAGAVQGLTEEIVDGNLWEASNVSIVDPKGLKEYRSFLIKLGDTDRCLCSVTYDTNTEVYLAADERRYYVTQVAAPPADVTRVTVLTGIATAPDVAITG